MFKSSEFHKYFEINSDDERPKEDYYVVKAYKNGVYSYWFGRKTDKNTWSETREEVSMYLGIKERKPISENISDFLIAKGYEDILFAYLTKKEVDKMRGITYNLKCNKRTY